MSIQIHIPARFARSVAKGQDAFEVKGYSVVACIKELITIVPRIEKSLFYSESEVLRSTVQVLLNNEPLDAKGLMTKVNDGDHIKIKHHIR